MDFNDSNLPYWLALYFVPGLRLKQFNLFIEYFPDLKELFELSINDLEKLGVKTHVAFNITQPNWSQVEEHLSWAEQKDNRILTLKDNNYPKQLLEIANPPPILFAKGKLAYLSKPQLAMVGSRKPSPQGKQAAVEFTKSIAQNDIVITSGLALGIDGICHQEALKCDRPTVAVMGTGINLIYPRRHLQLAEQIVANGVIISEFPLNSPPSREHFPRRNRIISGLSLGVLVVEAALRSGTLITAKYALEQNREVFAIPNSIHNPLARGCHQLIKQGAILVEKAEDIFDELGIESEQVTENNGKTKKKLAKQCAQVLECIEFAPTSIDRIVQQSLLTPQKIASILLHLELQGYISSEGGLYSRLV